MTIARCVIRQSASSTMNQYSCQVLTGKGRDQGPASPFKRKKRPCLGGGKHDRFYVSAPRCVSGGEEARRVFANIAREEVSAVSGIFSSTREEVSGSETGV